MLLEQLVQWIPDVDPDLFISGCLSPFSAVTKIPWTW